MIKDRMNGGDSTVKLSAGQHLLASAQSGTITLFAWEGQSAELTLSQVRSRRS